MRAKLRAEFRYFVYQFRSTLNHQSEEFAINILRDEHIGEMYNPTHLRIFNADAADRFYHRRDVHQHRLEYIYI